jgi:hypothetical protein
MSDVLEAILPIFLVMFAGAGFKLAGVIHEDWIGILNKYGLYVAFPAVIVHSLLNTRREEALDFPVLGLATALLLLILALSWFVTRRLGISKSLANTYVVCIFFGNIGYLGFPFITSVLPGSAGMVSLHISIYNVLLFSAVLVMLEHSKGHAVEAKFLLKKIATNPLLLSVLLGIILLLVEARPPRVIDNALDMLAKSASPVVLIALGIFLVRKTAWRKVLGHAALLSFFKLVVGPLMFLAAWHLFEPGPAFRVSILEAAMPLAITPFALAEEYPLERELIVAAVILSTLLSALTLTGFVAAIR